MPIEVSFGLSGDGQDNTTEERDIIPLLSKLKWTKNDKMHFGNKISNAMLQYTLSHDDNKNVEELTSCFIKAADFKIDSYHKGSLIRKQPWFDYECASQRKLVFKLLNQFRKTNNNEVKLQYNREQRKFKNLCNEKKLSHYRNLIESVRQITEGKRFWEAINSFKKGEEKSG